MRWSNWCLLRTEKCRCHPRACSSEGAWPRKGMGLPSSQRDPCGLGDWVRLLPALRDSPVPTCVLLPSFQGQSLTHGLPAPAPKAMRVQLLSPPACCVGDIREHTGFNVVLLVRRTMTSLVIRTSCCLTLETRLCSCLGKGIVVCRGHVAGVRLLGPEQVCPGRERGGTISASEVIQAQQSGHRGRVTVPKSNASCWVSHVGVFSYRIFSVAAAFMTLSLAFLLLFSFLRCMLSYMSLILSTYRAESCLGGV